MNTKIQLFIIVIVAFFSVSFTVAMAVHFGKEEVSSRSIHNSVKESDINSPATDYPGQADASIGMVPISQQIPGFDGVNTDDDGITHHFHFNRLRKVKKCATILCVVAKGLVVLTHLALLLCGYCHMLHQ